MPHIKLEDHLPGVTGLLEYRKDTSTPLRELTQILLRGPSSLSEADREMIAALVSHKNKCVYCATSHTAAANAYLQEEETLNLVKQDISTSPISNKMKALLTIAAQVQVSGREVSADAIDKAKSAGATDMELHDTVMIAALFCFYNRYVDGLATIAPTDPEYYSSMAVRLKEKGYYRPEDGYAHLKNK
ncbi:MAG: peroxidase-related enzyme [Bacteroidota bacterium]